MRIANYLVFMLMFYSLVLEAQTPAFPGAEGHGRYTTGGRGGVVFYVSNLTDDNSGNISTREGSLRWCLNQTGKKIVLFKVSGTIFLNTSLSISKGDVSILGQSAPGDGICIAGYPVYISANNVIIRYLRIRMGTRLGSNLDGSDALGANGWKNIIIDHCSMSWSTDECVSLYNNEKTTVQWCIISESLRIAGHSKGPHGYGGIWGGKYSSFHHNLLAHHDSRTPRFGPGSNTLLNEFVDMRNCVVYNWTGNGCYGGEAMNVNIVNNFFKPGPGTPTGTKRGRIMAIDKKTGLSPTDGLYPINNIWGKFYITGNVVDPSTSSSSSDITICNNATNDNWTYGVYNQISSSYNITQEEKTALKMAEPFVIDIVTTHSAQIAYEKVLTYSGASLYRDAHDARIIDEVSSGKAAFKGLSPYNGLGVVSYPAGTVIGNDTLKVTTTIDWKSIGYPKWGIIDNQNDIKPAGADANWSPWPALNLGTPYSDSNIDGIPDGWLEQNYPGKTANELNAEGYSYIEVYWNGIVNNITINQNSIGGTTSNKNISNQLSDVKFCLKTGSKILNIRSECSIEQVIIYSLTGTKLLEVKPGSSHSDLNCSGLASGIYVAQVIFGGHKKASVSKIIIP